MERAEVCMSVDVYKRQLYILKKGYGITAFFETLDDLVPRR